VVIPFVSQEDVLAHYRAWAGKAGHPD